MPRQDIQQDPNVQPEQDARLFEVLDGSLQIADLDRLPAILTPSHMQTIFRIKHSLFYTLVKQGQFDRFEIRPRIGRRAWSGVLVGRYLKAGGRESFVFGRRSA